MTGGLTDQKRLTKFTVPVTRIPLRLHVRHETGVHPPGLESVHTPSVVQGQRRHRDRGTVASSLLVVQLTQRNSRVAKNVASYRHSLEVGQNLALL